MPPAVNFPPPLLDAARKGKLAILFGSGLSLGVPGKFPRWTELPHRLLEQAGALGIWNSEQIRNKRDFFKAGHLSLEDMLSELDTLKTAFGGTRKYRTAMGSIFRPNGAAPGEVHRAIAELGVKVVLTTNYDLLFEAVSGPPERTAYTWRESDKALADIDEDRQVLFKIHGSAQHDDSIVMTRAEYKEAADHRPYQRALSYLFQSYTFLIVGYGINDPLDLDLVFGLNASTFGSAARTHYALMRNDVHAADRDRWQRAMNVQVVEYADHRDLPAILRSLPRPSLSPSVSASQSVAERMESLVEGPGAESGAPAPLTLRMTDMEHVLPARSGWQGRPWWEAQRSRFDDEILHVRAHIKETTSNPVDKAPGVLLVGGDLLEPHPLAEAVCVLFPADYPASPPAFELYVSGKRTYWQVTGGWSERYWAGDVLGRLLELIRDRLGADPSSSTHRP